MLHPGRFILVESVENETVWSRLFDLLFWSFSSLFDHCESRLSVCFNEQRLASSVPNRAEHHQKVLFNGKHVGFISLTNPYTDSTKINRPEHNIRMYWANFRQPTAHVQQNILGKTIIEFCSLHLYASFGNFCVQIGLLISAQWVFKHSEEFRNRRHFPSNILSSKAIVLQYISACV